MKIQYISDNTGLTTGVFIPIDEWKALKVRLKGIEEEEISIPGWHRELVQERLATYKSNPKSAKDLDSSLDEIEDEL